MKTKFSCQKTGCAPAGLPALFAADKFLFGLKLISERTEKAFVRAVIWPVAKRRGSVGKTVSPASG
jgi:hypothetical protein